MIRLDNVTQYISHVPQYQESGNSIRNKKPTSNRPQDITNTKSALDNKTIVTFEIHDIQLQPSQV